MNIVGITFDGELREYVIIEALKISKWINPADLSLDVIFRLTIGHIHGKDGFKRIRGLYVYFRKEDLDNAIIDLNIMKKEKEIIKKTRVDRSRERKLEEKISAIEGYIHPIITEKVIIEDDGEKKRIRVDLEDYEVTEGLRKRNVFFSLRFNNSIVSFDSGITDKEKPWTYNCMIEPYTIQTIKWDTEEFMPVILSLEIWLQLPKKLYSAISAIDVQSVSHLEQMFLLGKEIAKRFRDAGQPLAQEDTLCINWTFSNVSISSLPDEIGVTWGLRHFREEDKLIERFESNPRDTIPTLREILYICRVKTLDFGYIISKINDKNLRELLKVFDMMLFRRNWGPMKKNLDLLLSLLENFRSRPYGEEFYRRYKIFHALISVKNSEDFSPDLLTLLKWGQELKSILDPDYSVLFQDFVKVIDISQESKYKVDIISEIDRLYYKWINNLIYSDKYILTEILYNLKTIVEREYEEKVLLPEIETEIKTKQVAFSDHVGFIITIRNLGEGEAREVHAVLIQKDDYSIIVGKTESKAILMNGMRPFEPEMVIKPLSAGEITISYEVFYKDVLGREAKNQFEGTLDFIRGGISFKKAENPYIIGDIVRKSQMFFGREELIQSIINNFKGKYQINPIFLYGQRRTGKTSILFHLKKKLDGEFAPVYFTALEIFGEKLFCEDLMKKMIEELGYASMTTPHIEGDSFHVFKDRFYPRLKERLKGRKIVLIIDEYQRIDELIAEGFYEESVIDFLTALAHDGEIKIIISGFLQPDELLSNKWIEMLRSFTTKNVTFLRRKDAIELIRKPIKKWMKYDDASIEKIISLSGCHPYFIQLICHTMVECHNEAKIGLIGYDTINSHLFDYFERGYNVFVDIINNQIHDTGREILRAMQSTMEKERKTSIHRSGIQSYLEKNGRNTGRDLIERELIYLEKKEIIRKSTEHPDYYEFTIDLYRYWTKWEML